MEKVKIGDTIKIIRMDGEPQYTNREGVVTHIDDAGQFSQTKNATYDGSHFFTYKSSSIKYARLYASLPY